MESEYGSITVKSQDDVREKDVMIYIRYSNLYIFDDRSQRADFTEDIRRQVEAVSEGMRGGR